MTAIKAGALLFALCSKGLQLYCAFLAFAHSFMSQPYFHTTYVYLHLPLFFRTLDLA